MPDYNKLILDLESALRTQEQMSAGYRDRIESLETALNLERTLSEQRNRTIGELGTSLTAMKIERDDLRDCMTDCVAGANMMLAVPVPLSPSFKRYIEEVKRVSEAALAEAKTP